MLSQNNLNTSSDIHYNSKPDAKQSKQFLMQINRELKSLIKESLDHNKMLAQLKLINPEYMESAIDLYDRVSNVYEDVITFFRETNNIPELQDKSQADLSKERAQLKSLFIELKTINEKNEIQIKARIDISNYMMKAYKAALITKKLNNSCYNKDGNIQIEGASQVRDSSLNLNSKI